MIAPKVSTGNFREAYPAYRNLRPNRPLLTLISAGSLAVYRPHDHYAKGAPQQVERALKNGTRLIYACVGHVSVDDQYPIAGVLAKKKEYRPTVINTAIFAKRGYFNSLPMRMLMGNLGGIEVVREKDLPEGEKHLTGYLGKAAMDVGVDLLETGLNTFTFVQGERKPRGTTKIGDIEEGVGYMAVKASDRNIPVAFQPMAIWREGRFGAYIYFDNLIEGPFLGRTRDAMAELVPTLHNSFDRVMTIAGVKQPD